MLFDIHPDASVPIYEQIVAQLIFGIASGAVEPGATIPSIRELADKLIVNPNTVARAVQELERRGVVASKRGVGMEVTEAAPDLCRTERKDIIRRRIREALQEAASSALSPDDIRRIVDDELAKANGHRRSKERH